MEVSMRIKERSVRAIVLADGPELGPGSILEAGYKDRLPKCMLQVGGQTLIVRILKMLNAFGIINVTVVTGHKSALVEKEGGFRARYVKNPFYHVLGSVASLWFARHCLRDSDVLVLNAGMFFEEAVLTKLLDDSESNFVLLSDSSRQVDTSNQFLLKEGELCGYSECGKAVMPTDAYLGVAKISASFIDEFRSCLRLLVEEEKWADQRWEDTFVRECQRFRVEVRDVSGMFWSGLNCSKDYDDVVAWVDAQRDKT